MSAAWPPSPHLPPAAAPPGTLGREPAAPKSWVTLGTLCMVLSGAQLFWFLYTVGSAALGLAALRYASGAAYGGASAGAGPDLQQVFAAVEAFARKQAMWEIARGVPFAACSVALFIIGFGIYKGREKSLRAARNWVWAALAVVAASLCIQIFVTIPASLEYQRLLMRKMELVSGGGASPGAPVLDRMNTYNMIMAVVAPLGWSVILAGWPIVLRVWADRLLREQPPA